jgi:alpha-ribazole phosphatase
MIRLLLARHGPTDWNATGHYQGHQDIALSAVGRHQAERLATCLAKEPIEAIYASDLQRTTATAVAAADRCHAPITPDGRLRELHFGDWEGLTYNEIRQRYYFWHAAWQADPAQTAPPNGETLVQLAERVGTFLAELLVDFLRSRTILIVGHRGSLQVLLCLALGLPVSHRHKFNMEPASLSELHMYQEGAILIRLNDLHHLEEATDAR